MSQSRQLAAIMFTDIVGFTALMGNDERKTFEILEQNRQLHKPIIGEYNGRWIKELGDGVMASFHNVSDAVNAAVKIMEACDVANAYQLCIGIHLAEVVFENHDVFGKGVNIQNNSQYISWEYNNGVINHVNNELEANTCCHEGGHGLGCGHDTNSNNADDDARAFVNMDPDIYIHSHMKSTNILSAEGDAFSGPNSYAINYLGDTIHLWDGYRNNAYYCQMVLEAFYVLNEVTQARIAGSDCGAGQLVVETNVANTFSWSVPGGENIILDISEGDTVVNYIAYEEGTIMLLASKTGQTY
jgi:hypothetical protein